MSNIRALTPLPSSAGWQPELLEVSRIRMPGPDFAPAGVLEEQVEVPTNILLLTGHDATVVVDAGEGILASWHDCEGPGLPAALDGREPDVIVITHLDWDHVGGVLAGAWPGELVPAFPSTPVVVLDVTARAARAADPDRPWNAGTRSVAMLDRAGLLREVADGEELAEGLRLRAAPGHRSGHAVLEAGGGLLHLADTIHHPLHVEHPDWDGRHDGDKEVALATRVALLEEAAARGTLCVASHVRGPGHVVRSGDGLRWAAL